MLAFAVMSLLRRPKEEERERSFRDNSGKQRGEESLILDTGNPRSSKFAVSELEPPAFKGPCRLRLSGNQHGQKN